MQEDKYSGSVLLTKDGQILFKEVYGFPCKRYDLPNRIETKFYLDSMNKMFTSTAMSRLAQLGKLSFDHPVIKHLLDYPNSECRRD